MPENARPRKRRALQSRPRLPRVRRVRRPHARPVLRPVHLRPLPPGLRAAGGRTPRCPKCQCRRRGGSGQVPVEEAGVIGAGAGTGSSGAIAVSAARSWLMATRRGSRLTMRQSRGRRGSGGEGGGRGSGREHRRGVTRSASITVRGARARTAGAPASASITSEGASARTAGATASASITTRGAYALRA